MVRIPLPDFDQFAKYLNNLAATSPNVVVGITGTMRQSPSARFLSASAKRALASGAAQRGEQIDVEVWLSNQVATMTVYVKYPEQKVVFSEINIDPGYYMLEALLTSNFGPGVPASAQMASAAAQTILDLLHPIKDERQPKQQLPLPKKELMLQ